MYLHLRAHGVALDVEFRDMVDRKLRFTFARFEHVVRRIFVTITDQNGPKGGEDKICRIRLATAFGPALVIEELDSSAERAVGAAVERAARSVARELARARNERRAGQPNRSARALLRMATTAG